MNAIDFTPLAQAILTLLAAIISVHLIPWIKTKLNAEQLGYAKTAVEIAVYAAEKAYGAGNGDQKLQYAKDVLAARGVHLDTLALKSMVDAAIKKMENEDPFKVLEALPAEETETATLPDEEDEEGEEDEEKPQTREK